MEQFLAESEKIGNAVGSGICCWVLQQEQFVRHPEPEVRSLLCLCLH